MTRWPRAWWPPRRSRHDQPDRDVVGWLAHLTTDPVARRDAITTWRQIRQQQATTRCPGGPGCRVVVVHDPDLHCGHQQTRQLTDTVTEIDGSRLGVSPAVDARAEQITTAIINALRGGDRG